MDKQVYSAKNNAFYLLAMKSQYESAGAWPTDGVSVADAVFNEFAAPAPVGKIRAAGRDGLPVWVDIPHPPREQLIVAAERNRQELLSYADRVIADWRTELALDEISDGDKVKLSAWMAYKRAVKAVSAEDAVAPDFAWPVQPEG